jgi:ABC-type glycerol-3-phosphate transport system permease component
LQLVDGRGSAGGTLRAILPLALVYAVSQRAIVRRIVSGASTG